MPRSRALGRRVGRRLRDLRKAAGFTQADLAERLGPGVAPETVSRFERGAADPTLGWIERMCVALDVPVEVFFAPLARHEDPPQLGALAARVHGLTGEQLAAIIAVVDATIAAGATLNAAQR